jgi:hypothetical protein
MLIQKTKLTNRQFFYLFQLGNYLMPDTNGQLLSADDFLEWAGYYEQMTFSGSLDKDSSITALNHTWDIFNLALYLETVKKIYKLQ